MRFYVGLRLVNTAPGTAREPVKPGQPLQLGLKSETETVNLGSVRISFGMTAIHHEGLLPESNPNLTARGAEIVIDTVERARPVDGADAISIVGGNIVFLKTSSSQNDECVYEVTSHIPPNSPALGYFEFLVNSSLVRASKPWSAEDVTGLYLGLEHGTYNTACYAFLGDGVIHAGGVLQSWNTTRPGHQVIDFDWTALPNGTKLGIWIYFNIFGYPPPYVPAYTPLAEVWTSVNGASPVLQYGVPVGMLEHFPTPHGNTTNIREGPDDIARLFFGFSGDSGESLTLTDWALFPDYRIAVHEGMPLPGNEYLVKPDGPSEYEIADGLPTEARPGRWMLLSDATAVRPSTSPAYSPGKRKAPTFVSLEKTLPSMSGFEKKEPRLEQRQGFMFEAFMAGFQTSRVSDQFGAGFLVDDCSRICRVSLLEEVTGKKTIGMLTDDSMPDAWWAYMQSPEIDWNSLKRVRVTGDYLRNKASFFVEDEYVGQHTLNAMPLSSSTQAKVAFGHLQNNESLGELQVAFTRYLSRFRSWETIDNNLPEASDVPFTLVTAGDHAETLTTTVFAVDDPNHEKPPTTLGSLLLDKKPFATADTKAYYSRADDFEETNGLLVDFKARVVGYTDRRGYSFSAQCWVGSGLDILLGSKKLHLGFFDCGTFGRKVGIIPGSGSVNDIIDQTDLGKAFSGSVDWTQAHTYRLVYKAYDRIEVWVDNVAGQSIINIPWAATGFDLPEDFSSAAIRFGHFDSSSSSLTEWWAVRYGQSNGFEVSVQRSYEDPPSYLFGGRVVLNTEFGE